MMWAVEGVSMVPVLSDELAHFPACILCDTLAA
jgi:hypothetical protein